jgi:hypothetical protein
VVALPTSPLDAVAPFLEALGDPRLERFRGQLLQFLQPLAGCSRCAASP